jgi:hypothetical protein
MDLMELFHVLINSRIGIKLFQINFLKNHCYFHNSGFIRLEVKLNYVLQNSSTANVLWEDQLFINHTLVKSYNVTLKFCNY